MAKRVRARKLTARQTKAIDEADAILGRALGKAQAKLAGLGDELEFSRCLRCSCEFFVPRSPDIIPGADAPAMACMRVGCRHLFTSHKFF
jgi:hypothetical protein